MPTGTERNSVRRNDREGKNKLLVILQKLLTAKATVLNVRIERGAF